MARRRIAAAEPLPGLEMGRRSAPWARKAADRETRARVSAGLLDDELDAARIIALRAAADLVDAERAACRLDPDRSRFTLNSATRTFLAAAAFVRAGAPDAVTSDDLDAALDAAALRDAAQP